MKIVFICLYLLQFVPFKSYSQDSAISFVNATKQDDLIVLARVLSHAAIDYSVAVLPKSMVVEVFEVLKGDLNYKQITIKGSDTTPGNNLASLLFYEVGKIYIFSLRNFELIGLGCHSLDFGDEFVRGNISNEPDTRYRNKLNQLFNKFVEAEKVKDKNPNKYSQAKTALHKHYELLNQTMSYADFKILLTMK